MPPGQSGAALVPPSVAQELPRTPARTPRSPQERQVVPRVVPGAPSSLKNIQKPKEFQRFLKGEGGAIRARKCHQGGSQAPPGELPGPPRPRPDDPSGAQERPGGPQESPGAPQEAARTPQEPPWGPPAPARSSPGRQHVDQGPPRGAR